MINLVVWSKDRAAQLHLLMESINRFMPNTFVTSVIFKASNQEFAEGYDKVAQEFEGVDFDLLPETADNNLEKLTKEVISDESFDYIAFSTDDTVIFRQPEDNIFRHLHASLATFSLRLGLNTLAQDIHRGTFQPPLNKFFWHNGVPCWRFDEYHPNDNYGYPFGLDMHIYCRGIVWPIINDIEFRNTNELESKLFYKKGLIPPYMSSFKHSVAVNIPANNHSQITLAGKQYPADINWLNSQYLEGKRLNLEKIMNTEVIGCHQEMELEFV